MAWRISSTSWWNGCVAAWPTEGSAARAVFHHLANTTTRIASSGGSVPAGCRTFEQLIQTITTDLAVLLDLDVAALVVEANGAERPTYTRQAYGWWRLVQWMAGSASAMLCLLRPSRRPRDIRRRRRSGRSQALIRIQVSEDTPAGLLAFGSRDPEMSHSGQGTELVCFLARVIERSIGHGWTCRSEARSRPQDFSCAEDVRRYRDVAAVAGDGKTGFTAYAQRLYRRTIGLSGVPDRLSGLPSIDQRP